MKIAIDNLGQPDSTSLSQRANVLKTLLPLAFILSPSVLCQFSLLLLLLCGKRVLPPPDCLLPQTGPSSSCLLPAWIPLLDSQDVSQPDFPASGWYSQPHNFPHLEVPGFTPTPAIKLRNHVLWCLLCLKCFQLLSHRIESAFAGWKYMLPCLVQASGQDTGCWEEERSSHRTQVAGRRRGPHTGCWSRRRGPHAPAV